jgi:hypothetical protein
MQAPHRGYALAAKYLIGCDLHVVFLPSYRVTGHAVLAQLLA